MSISLIVLMATTSFSPCPWSAMSRQLFQECLRLLQIYGVETLGEPIVDPPEHLSRFVVLPVFAKETTETSHGSELERLRALLAGNLDGLPKARFGFGVRSEGLVNAYLARRVGLKCQRSLQPIQLCLEEALAGFVACRESFLYGMHPVFGLLGLETRIDQKSEIHGSEQHGPCRSAGGQPIADLRDTFVV